MSSLESAVQVQVHRLVEWNALTAIGTAALVLFATVEEAIAAADHSSRERSGTQCRFEAPNSVLSQGIRYLSTMPRSTLIGGKRL